MVGGSSFTRFYIALYSKVIVIGTVKSRKLSQLEKGSRDDSKGEDEDGSEGEGEGWL